MILSIELVIGVSLLYIALLFLVAYYADWRQNEGKSIISNPLIYSFSLGVYATTWTYYGSVGKAATTGLDFLLIYLGPTLTAFSWWFLLRKIVRISKENNITSIADFLSSRYGKSQWLGALVTIVAIVGIMPYIALQLKAVSSTFDILCGYPYAQIPFMNGSTLMSVHTSFIAALLFSLFGIMFGARHLISSERHEGLVAAIALESIVKLLAFMSVGVFVTYGLFDGFGDIFSRMQARKGMLDHLVTIGGSAQTSYMTWSSMLYLSMGAIILLPRQFHILVIENSNEEHIKKAMWLFPIYMFLINLFVMPIALGGILYTGDIIGADYFVLTLPLKSGNSWLALLTFIGGFSAAAGMIMLESVALSTMFLNHLIMPIFIKLNPGPRFPSLLINLKRFGIFLVIFLGYIYQQIVGETYMLVNIGLISFAAASQFGPALLGGLYWRRGSKAGAIAGIFLGSALWFYTLLLPSFVKSGWWRSDILENGPFGIQFLRPTELFGLAGFDIWSHSLLWSMFFNVGGYLACSLFFPQKGAESEQAGKFVDVMEAKREESMWEAKRLSKPVTIIQFVNLMTKFIGEQQAYAAITEYMGNRDIDEQGGVSEFELPELKRFIEKTLAGSLGGAAAGAIVESYLSDLGSKMEPFYDIFSTVRSELSESRETLSVRLRASEIMSKTQDLPVIMNNLLDLIRREFNFDLAVIRLVNVDGVLETRSFSGAAIPAITERLIVPDVNTYIGDAFLSNQPRFLNDTRHNYRPDSREIVKEVILSFAHIPIAREGEPPVGILSVFSRAIVGLFTQPFIDLLSSLAGQLAQATKIDSEMRAKERERLQKEAAILENVRVTREMEIAKQIQLSLLPPSPPDLSGALLACRCIPATHVGGDYYDFFRRGNSVIDIVIADVSGHSVGAALIMAETRSVLRTQFHATNNPSDLLAMLNEGLYDDLTNAELFITMFYVKYNMETRVLTYGSAGHNRPLLFRPGADSCVALDAEGLILGVKKNVRFEEKSMQLQRGDVLLMYTDGATEAENGAGEMFGDRRLCGLISAIHGESPDTLVDRIVREVTSFADPDPLKDDLSLVIMKVT